MRQNPKKTVNKELKKDPQKESLIRELSEKLANVGIKVRREKLKAGPGWRVVSGACRMLADKMIFIDPRLTQDEQILFLNLHLDKQGNFDTKDNLAA